MTFNFDINIDIVWTYFSQSGKSVDLVIDFVSGRLNMAYLESAHL